MEINPVRNSIPVSKSPRKLLQAVTQVGKRRGIISNGINKKVWVEIHASALKKNIRAFRSIIGSRVKLWAVIKSNAYGHGLLTFSELGEKYGGYGFCVDSVVEGLKLRRARSKKMILVLGPTLEKENLEEAAKHGIELTISTFEALAALKKLRRSPSFHLKIDTGMHRQGFLLAEVDRALSFIKKYCLPITGIYTHFAHAKDPRHAAFTRVQFNEFKKALAVAKKAGFTSLIRHAAATGAALKDSRYCLDAVRIGKGLYGLWPDTRLSPVLSWRTRISEIKNVPRGAYIGYDLTERMSKQARLAVIPIGYWHGFPRALSSIGEVLIGGKRARVVGRISMDLTMVDVTKIPAEVGTVVTLIGRSGVGIITAETFGERIGISNSEAVTRINPLIERVIT